MPSPYRWKKIAASAIVACGAAGALGVLTAQTSRSVWDGVYTEAQAKRGATFYASQCSQCHGADLAGGDQTPPLSGGEFLSNWNAQSLGDLFEKIRVSMPADKPGSLSRQQTSDILAYVLSFDKFPSGGSELPTQVQDLKPIRFESYKP